MKKITTGIRALGIYLALFGTLAVTSSASAVVVNHSGTICKNYNRADVSYIDYYGYGTRSLKSTSTYVICPIVRPINTANGATVYVDGKHTVSAQTCCTAYSYSWTGIALGSRSQCWTGVGVFELTLSLLPTSSWSDISVLCSIPGNGYGFVMGIDTAEN